MSGAGDGGQLGDAGHDAPQDAPEGLDAPQDAPEGLDAPQDAPEGLDAPQDAPEGLDAPQDAPDAPGLDAPQDAPEGLDAPQDAPGGLDAPQDAPTVPDAPGRLTCRGIPCSLACIAGDRIPSEPSDLQILGAGWQPSCDALGRCSCRCTTGAQCVNATRRTITCGVTSC